MTMQTTPVAQTLLRSPLARHPLELALQMLHDGVLRIDDEGRIWRVAERRNNGKGASRLIPVTPRRAENVGNKGYRRLTLGVSADKTRSVQAHRVIWVWFNGPIPEGLEVNHKDLNKHHNRLSTLELVTPTGTMDHAYAQGRARAYQLSHTWRGRPVLTDEQKAEMRRLRATGMYWKDSGARFGCTATHAMRVVHS